MFFVKSSNTSYSIKQSVVDQLSHRGDDEWTREETNTGKDYRLVSDVGKSKAN